MKCQNENNKRLEVFDVFCSRFQDCFKEPKMFYLLWYFNEYYERIQLLSSFEYCTKDDQIDILFLDRTIKSKNEFYLRRDIAFYIAYLRELPFAKNIQEISYDDFVSHKFEYIFCETSYFKNDVHLIKAIDSLSSKMKSKRDKKKAIMYKSAILLLWSGLSAKDISLLRVKDFCSLKDPVKIKEIELSVKVAEAIHEHRKNYKVEGIKLFPSISQDGEEIINQFINLCNMKSEADYKKPLNFMAIIESGEFYRKKKYNNTEFEFEIGKCKRFYLWNEVFFHKRNPVFQKIDQNYWWYK